MLAFLLACAICGGKPPVIDVTTPIEGVARDAKLGAVVVLADGSIIYVEGLDRWPEDVHGSTVRVRGRVERRSLGSEPLIGPNGEVSAGAEGEADVIVEWDLEG